MSVIDDLTEEIQDLTDNLSDLSDNTDASVNDIQSTLSDHSDTLDELGNSAGQLTFPLSPDTVDLIKEIFPTGLATLVAGTVTISDPRVSAVSNIGLTYSGLSGTPGALSYAASAGSFTITSTPLKTGGGIDNSVVSYIIYN